MMLSILNTTHLGDTYFNELYENLFLIYNYEKRSSYNRYLLGLFFSLLISK